MREILLATSNSGKAREMAEILLPGGGQGESQAPSVRWRFLSEFADRGWPEPIENADTFLENAEIKARHYARLSGLWTIADDSGLVVDALGGDPGVRSARFAGEPKSDAANNRLLLERLNDVSAERRTARFVCAVVLADGGRVLASAEGQIEGRIMTKPRGASGFGYDPLFEVAGTNLTAAQMTPDQKHAVSHRGQALRRMQQKLAELL